MKNSNIIIHEMGMRDGLQPENSTIKLKLNGAKTY